MASLKIPKDYQKQTMRSVHNRSCIRRSTIHCGIGIPIYSRRVMAGEKIFLDPTTVLQTNALQAPLMGSFTLQLAVYFDSDSNYYSWMDNNNKSSTDEYLKYKRHRISFSSIVSPNYQYGSSYDNFADRLKAGGVQPSSLLNYMGFPMLSQPLYGENGIDGYDDIGAINNPSIDLGFVLTYLNIFRNYYANNQEEQFPFIYALNSATSGEDVPFVRSDLKILDKLFKELRFLDDGFDFDNVVDQETFPGMYWFRNTFLKTIWSNFGGLWMCTYKPDLLVNLLSSASTVKSYVKTDGNSFSIDTLRFQNKLQRLIDRLDVSGGRFSNWLRAVWGIKTRRNMDIPEMIGVTQKLIDPTELTAKSNSASIDGQDSQFLGDLGGNFNKIDGHRGHSFTASTSGRIMVIATLVPNVDYVQGLDWEVDKVNFADDYVPEFAQLGFQKVPLSRYSFLPIFKESAPDASPSMDDDYSSHDTLSVSVGKQVAWLEEMTDVNRNFGEFDWKGYYNYWVLNRLYSRLEKKSYNDLGSTFEPTITQYVNPLEYQYPFVAQSVLDPNWFLQVGFKIKSVRPIGKRYMPNLE